MIELVHQDGGTELIRDPHNDTVAPGPFGDKSVFEMPGYTPPPWIEKAQENAGDRYSHVDVKSRPLRTRLPSLIWSPAGHRAGRAVCRCWSFTTGPSTGRCHR